jgi:hypothetical protein
MNYSIRYQNDKGITERSEFLAFDSDGAATDHARIDAPRHSIVEIWKGDVLLARTFKKAP